MALQAGVEPVPAKFFESGYSFAEFVKLFESENDWKKGEWYHEGKLQRMPVSFPRQVVDFPSIAPPITLTIEINGPIEALCVWGHGLITI